VKHRSLIPPQRILATCCGMVQLPPQSLILRFISMG